jgi:hypothetical protein
MYVAYSGSSGAALQGVKWTPDEGGPIGVVLGHDLRRRNAIEMCRRGDGDGIGRPMDNARTVGHGGR